MTAIPIAIYWGLAVWGLLSSRPVLLYLFMGSLGFSSFAVIPPAVTAGLTFVPATMTAFLIILKTFSKKQRLLIAIGSSLKLNRFGILLIFLVLSFVVTLFMPRIFAGTVQVVTMSGATVAPLYPTVQNISQLAYLSISVLVVIALSQVLSTREMRQTALKAIVVGSCLTILTGLLDYASQFLPIGPVLEMFRTASYAMLVDAEMLGGKRVVGLAPEASAFGSVCLSQLCLLYFLRRGMADDFIRDRVIPVAIGLLVVLIWLSTSSAAYVGLGVFAGLACVEWLIRMFDQRYNPLRKRQLGLEFGIVATAIGLLALFMLVNPRVIDGVLNAIDELVLKKSGSDSYIERNMWTAVSLNALFETYGLGVGLGSTRASNIFVAAVSSVGVFGAMAYFGFIGQCFLMRADPRDPEAVVLLSALRYALIPPFVVGVLIGTTADFGPIGAFRYAMMMAIGFGGMTYAWQRKLPVRTSLRTA
ncbi:hypothetical protein ASG43_07110 [Aureimonas sp. Leaf454]|uniref:hypothetical protein n=1 Tax=Aureimonas sp. Leaf454 TaxID=1736381 RepID=UPI000700C9FB|nr:hypothetical protein [Aureimonas sp. Leaf454]KQT51005.1 hypothetical protein ASG43_07110 [Aureimonas sp. Leaf454]